MVSLRRLHRRHRQRGPPSGADHVLVMFEKLVSEGERTLVKRATATTSPRCAGPIEAMIEASNLVSEITGRQAGQPVVTQHLDAPDMAAEVLVSQPDGAGDQQPQEAEHREEPSTRL